MRYLFASLLLLATSGHLRAQEPVSVPLVTPLVADISQNSIEIHSSFTGMQLLVFGARNQPGDLVLVVRGPEDFIVLRRKERIAGMWMHVEQEKYPNLPLFYGFATTKPLELIAPENTLRALGLGVQQIIDRSNSRSMPNFDEALINQLDVYRLWQRRFGEITYFGESLFKAKIDLPDRLPRGLFTVEAYLFDRGQLVGFQTIPLHTFKTGFDATVFDTAQHEPWIYGLAAIAMALSGGWLAHRLFNRRA